jgi:hypothetical protein
MEVYRPSKRVKRFLTKKKPLGSLSRVTKHFLRIPMASAFKKWSPQLGFEELMRITEIHRKNQERLVQESLDNYELLIFEERIICYKKRKVVVIQ